jgi:type II secretory pathway component PulF
MAVFAYQGTGIKGERLSGELEASSRAEALRRLAKDQIQPLSLTAKENVVAGGKTAGLTDKLAERGPATGGISLSRSQVILFTDELADFLHSGLQLEPSLHLMENREERSAIKQVAAFLREKVRDGMSFSDALRLASPNFGELYCNLVAAGEASGALSILLRRQARYLVVVAELRSQIVLALIYPAFLVVAGIVAMIVFMTVLVPQMMTLFSKTGSVMPLPTYLLFKFGNFSQHYGLLTLSVVVLASVAFMIHIRQPNGRRWWDEAKLKIPLFGPLLSAAFYAQFCQTMANLLQNGLPLLSALKLMGKATGNVFYSTLVSRITDLVGEGASLTRAMKTVGHFPANLRDLVKVGEQTGDLGSTLEKVGQRYEKVIQQKIDRIMSLVQPVIIILLGLMVLLVAWSMMSGIFQAINGLKGHR